MKRAKTTLKFSMLAGVMALTGCSTTALSTSSASISPRLVQAQAPVGEAKPELDHDVIYAAMEDSGIRLPAFDHTKQNPRYLRRQVNYYGPQPVGSLVIDTKQKFLYFIMPDNRAMRYGIAVGKEGFEWAGDAVVQFKQKWPTWTPPRQMIKRKPELKEYANGMPPGVNNPLGARAMYLYKNGKDTLYRVHGTNQPYSIGNAASSGCFRLVNQDVIDLYARVSKGAKVFVRHGIQIREDV